MASESSIVRGRGNWEEIEPENRAAWRRWLIEHHGQASGVWVIWRKKSAGPGGITLEDTIREALCFGWIDSRLRPLSTGKSALLFTPRRPGSTWSKLNKQRVASLLADGLVTESGLRAIEAAQRDGSWEALTPIEELRIPDDLARAFAANPNAKANFDAFPASAKRAALWWIASAKREQTRARRVAETVVRAAQNRTVTASG